jgi:hypothetical protein
MIAQSLGLLVMAWNALPSVQDVEGDEIARRIEDAIDVAHAALESKQ